MRLFKITTSGPIKYGSHVRYVVATTISEAILHCCVLFPVDVVSVEELAAEVLVI